MEREINFTLNGKAQSLKIQSHFTLLYVLREVLNLTGTKEGCGHGECGACTVLLNGKAVNSCLILIAQVEGAEVETVESLNPEGTLHPIQKALLEAGAVQCGFCTPGILMSAKALLTKNPHPNDREIKTALAGNLCRCTGYAKIKKALKSYAGESNL